MRDRERELLWRQRTCRGQRLRPLNQLPNLYVREPASDSRALNPNGISIDSANFALLWLDCSTVHIMQVKPQQNMLSFCLTGLLFWSYTRQSQVSYKRTHTHTETGLNSDRTLPVTQPAQQNCWRELQQAKVIHRTSSSLDPPTTKERDAVPVPFILAPDISTLKTTTRMWANAQHDGRPAEHRWRPLFNAAKFGWRPLGS